MSIAMNEDFVEQHFQEASFLWTQRDVAVTSPSFTLNDLAELDARVESQIESLRESGEHGWMICDKGLDNETPGNLFTASVIAFESGSAAHIDRVVEASGHCRQMFRAAVSALGWLADDCFRNTIKSLVDNRSWQYRSLGIAACGIRRVNPRAYLNKAAESSNLFLKLSAFKAAGELKRLDLLPVLREHLNHEVSACRYEATRAALMMGDRSALDVFSKFALSDGKFTVPALQVALRLVDTSKSLEWLKEQSKKPEHRLEMLMCTGIIGNPAYIPMLIKQMRKPVFARAAASAFCMITGVELDEAGLEGVQPDSFENPSDDTPKENGVHTGLDENLSWPDAERVEQWWQEHHDAFPAGVRLLAGRPITPENCARILKNGNQRNRQAAALEVALSKPNAQYVNTKGFGPIQLEVFTPSMTESQSLMRS